jgi:hypothetical protein
MALYFQKIKNRIQLFEHGFIFRVNIHSLRRFYEKFKNSQNIVIIPRYYAEKSLISKTISKFNSSGVVAV